MVDYLAEAHALFEYTQGLRRDFHRHPELGFEEYRTAGVVVRELEKLDLAEIKTGIAQTGVVGILEGAKPGPVVLLRFDMDALPIEEETNAVYASENPGVMHACGHDGHTAVGLAVAKVLSAQKDSLAGKVKFVFQPAEEGLGGAKLMVKEGILENPQPDYAFSVHMWNENKVNWFGITPGPIMASAETFKVVIKGKGGHGAAPHQTIDPVYAASLIVTALQSIVSRNVPPLESAVVSVGSIQGGTAFNIIPPEVTLLGTIRTFKTNVRETVINRLHQVVKGISDSLGCTVAIEILSVTPAVNNHPELSKRVQAIARNIFPTATIDVNTVTMGSEDFAYMIQDIPGCYVFIGSSDSDRGLDAKHHHPKFDFDESALVNGVALVASVATDLLSG